MKKPSTPTSKILTAFPPKRIVRNPAPALRKVNKNRGISTDPQRSSSSQDTSSSKTKTVNDGNEYGGNVENFRNLMMVRDIPISACESLVDRWVWNKKMRGIGKGCQRQVFASEEVADNFIRALCEMGITGTAVYCSQCRLIHVNEVKRP